jgi:GDP-L-fucose synthase
MRFLILGHTGLVGSAIFRSLVLAGENVTGASSKEVNLLDNEATRDYILEISPNIVIDAAALVGGIGANNDSPVDFLDQNLRIQLNVMAACLEARVEKFVFLGSSCVYPKHSIQPIKEQYLMTGPLETTNSAYAIAKIAGIEMIKSYRKQFGVKWISLMPTNLYGPNDNFHLTDSHVLPAFIRRFVEAVELDADRVTLWGTGSPLREFLHVDDLARGVIVATKKYDSDLHLNIGTGNDLSIKQLAGKVASAAGFMGEIDWDPSKPDGTPRKVLDVSRVNALGWKPAITLDQGIASTIAWYKSASARGEIRK